MTVRANQQIWHIAKWIATELALDKKDRLLYPDFNKWEDMSIRYKNFYYDQIVKFLKKINNNEFTGPDNHE